MPIVVFLYGSYHLYVTDLGNVRAVTDASGTIEKTFDYYPFGESFSSVASSNPGQDFRYGGKQTENKFGNREVYDFSARWYSPVFGRFQTMDPLCEKYYFLSPYAYCANNPMNVVDPSGMWIFIYGEDGLTYKYLDGQLFQYQTDGEFQGQYLEYNPSEGSFLETVLLGLNDLSGTDTGAFIVSFFANDKHDARIHKSSTGKNGVDFNKFSVPIYLSGHGSMIPTLNGLEMSDFRVDLAHELAHVMDVYQGGLESANSEWLWAERSHETVIITRSEKYATHYENLLRLEMGYPLRSHYAVQEDNQPYEPSRLIDDFGRSVVIKGVRYKKR